MTTLAGKVALITGGGRGLGAAVCRTLARDGVHVVAADVRGPLVEQVVTELQASGVAAEGLSMDVSNASQVQRTVQSLVARHDRLDIVVNCAAIDKTVSVDELSPEEWSQIIAVNLSGPFFVSRAALAFMKRQRSGHIVNIASTAAKRCWPNASAYHASKWGVLGLSHALHAEAREYNVKVTAVVAGGMRTPFLLDRFPDIDLAKLQPPENVAETIRYVLMQPEETVIPEIMVLPMQETSWP